MLSGGIKNLAFLSFDTTEQANAALRAKVSRMVLNMFMFFRKHEHVAHVTFVETGAAEAFVHRASENETKQTGARRNLLIRRPKAAIPTESIIEDLAHVHRLKIVEIVEINGDIVVSLNSISHAITARTCMSSRLG